MPARLSRKKTCTVSLFESQTPLRGFAREAVENVLNVRRYADVAGEVTQAGSPPAIFFSKKSTIETFAAGPQK